MKYAYRNIELKKRYPLRISRGVMTGSINLFVTIKQEQHEGIGEAAPGIGAETAEACEQQLRTFLENQHALYLILVELRCLGLPVAYMDEAILHLLV